MGGKVVVVNDYIPEGCINNDIATLASSTHDGGSGDDHDYFLFWAHINGMAPTTAQDKAEKEKKAYTSQENMI